MVPDSGEFGTSSETYFKKGKNMKKTFGSIAITLMLLIVLASTTLAASEKEFLIRGSLKASETHQVIFPTAFIDLTGTGNATHLGLFTYQLQAELNLPTGSATASATLVAADGSSIFLEGTGQGTPTETPGMVSIVETYTITGGTGRFAGATGNVTVERVVNQATRTSTGTISGMIVLP
jgi:hypothetical protein